MVFYFHIYFSHIQRTRRVLNNVWVVMFFWAALTCSAVLGFRLRPLSALKIALFLDLRRRSEKLLAMASFDQVDANHDGVISREEWIGWQKNGRRAAEKFEISFHGSAAFRRFVNMVYSKDIFSVDTIEEILLSTFIVSLSSTYSCTSEFNIEALFFVPQTVW